MVSVRLPAQAFHDEETQNKLAVRNWINVQLLLSTV